MVRYKPSQNASRHDFIRFDLLGGHERDEVVGYVQAGGSLEDATQRCSARCHYFCYYSLPPLQRSRAILDPFQESRRV
jgi:hypothetical protein